MKIHEALKQLNKNVAKADQFKIASDQPKEHFVTEFYSTGNPYLDYKLGGGLPKGRFVLLLGGEGSAKTSISLITASNVQKEGKYVVYLDGENTVDESYLNRFNINRDLFIHHKDANLESMLNSAEVFSKSEDVGMIVIDSIPSFTSTVVEQKGAEDATMAVEARKYNARMPIIYSNTSRRNILLVGINFYKIDPGAMGDPRKIPRGEWQKYMSSLTLEFKKPSDGLILDNSKSPIGVRLGVKIKKSKLMKFNAKEGFNINFYYDFGFNIFDDYAEMLVEKEIISKSGSWYSLPSIEPNMTLSKLQGLHKVSEFLEDNPEYLEELIKLKDGRTNNDNEGGAGPVESKEDDAGADNDKLQQPSS